MDRPAGPRAAQLRVQGRPRPALTSVAPCGAAIRERAHRRAEAPRIGVRAEGQLRTRGSSHRAPRCSPGSLRTAAVPCRPSRRRTGEGHDGDRDRRLRPAARTARTMVVAGQHDVRPRGVKSRQKRVVRRVAAVLARRKARVVPVGEHARRGRPARSALSHSSCGEPSPHPPTARSSNSERSGARCRGRSCSNPSRDHPRARRNSWKSRARPSDPYSWFPARALSRLDATPRRVVRREVLRVCRVVVLSVAESKNCGVASAHERVRRRQLPARRAGAPPVGEEHAVGIARDVACSRDSYAIDSRMCCRVRSGGRWRTFA